MIFTGPFPGAAQGKIFTRVKRLFAPFLVLAYSLHFISDFNNLKAIFQKEGGAGTDSELQYSFKQPLWSARSSRHPALNMQHAP